MRIFYLFLLLYYCSSAAAGASLKLTFSGTKDYHVKLGGINYSVHNQYLQLESLEEGNYSITVYEKTNMLSVYQVYTSSIYLQDKSETIALFDNNMLSVKSVNYIQNNYNSLGGCGNSNIISSNQFSIGDFQKVLNEIKDESFDSKKKDRILSMIKYGSISSNQGMQILETFSFDSHRYESAIAIIPYVYDQHNLYLWAESFSFLSDKNKYLDYLESLSVSQNNNNGNWANSWGNQGIENASFSALLDRVNEESFDSNKSEIIIGSIKYSKVATAQAIELLKTFSFDSQRLDAAKEMEPYISDRHNYWQAGEVFDFTSNKNSFLEFIK